MSEEQLIASPAGVEIEGPPGACSVGQGPTIFLYGGQPPYKLKNSVPLGVSLDTTVVTGSGRGFTVTFINGACFTNAPIVVEDDMGRILNVPLTNTPGPKVD